MTGWVQLWDLRARKEISRAQVADLQVYHLQFSADGMWLAASCWDRLGRLYDLQGPEPRLLQTFPDAGLLSISPDKTRVAASYTTLRIYDPASYVETPTALGGSEWADATAVLTGNAIARVRCGSTAFERDPLRGESRRIGWFAGVPLVNPESGESWGIVKRAAGRLDVVDFDTHESVMTLPANERVPNGFRQFPDKRHAILYFADKTSEIWDTGERRVVKKLQTPQNIGTAKVSPDGRWLAAGLWGNELWVWDTTTWAARAFPRIGGGLNNVMFSPDGTRLVASTSNDNAEVWDVIAGRLLGKLVGHSQFVGDAAFAPDGRRIVTASGDRTVRVWDAATFRELTSLVGHRETVSRARFTANGESIVSIDGRGNAMMWLTKAPLTKAPQNAGVK